MSEQEKATIDHVLKPDKLFTVETRKDIKVGDMIEICPQAIQMTVDIMSLLEISRGNAMIIDYGEDHAFTNSFRV